MTLFQTIRLIASREYLHTVRRRGFILLTLLVPLALVAFVGFMQVVTEDVVDRAPLDTPIYVVNQSSLPLADVVAGATNPLVEIVSAGEAEQVRQQGVADETYLVPDDYLATGEVVRRVGAEPAASDFGRMDRIEAQQAALSAYLRSAVLAGHGLSAADVQRVTEGPVFLEHAARDAAPAAVEPDVSAFLVPYAFALLFVMSIMMTSSYLLRSVSEEKENRVVEQVLTSVPSLGLMAGKLVGLGAAGLTQVFVWVATALLAAPLIGNAVPLIGQIAPSPALLAIAVVYFVLGYVLYGAIYCAIGAIGSSTREATQFGVLAALFAALPIMLTIVFMQDPSSPLATAMVLFPLTAPAAALQVVSFAASPPWLLIGTSLILLAAAGLLAIVIGARMFRAATLLAGTAPRFGQILAVLRSG